MCKVIFFVFILNLVQPVLAEEISIQVKGLKIFGTLEIPSSDKPVLLVIIIAGSGPTDRDGNLSLLPGKNNSLKQVAEKLLANGIASFRYDKRMIGKSISEPKMREEDVNLEDFISDAVDCIEYFKKDTRFSGITIIGHSEGSLIGIIAAQRTKINGFISIAGVGRPYYELLSEQIKAGNTPVELAKQCNDIIDSLKAGKIVNNVNPVLLQLFRPSVQPFWISMFKHDPAVEISRLNIPVLIIQGTTDIQVSEYDANLLKKAAKRPTFTIIDGMNHVMKMVPTKDKMKQISSYSDPTLEISDQLVKSILEYMKSI